MFSVQGFTSGNLEVPLLHYTDPQSVFIASLDLKQDCPILFVLPKHLNNIS